MENEIISTTMNNDATFAKTAQRLLRLPNDLENATATPTYD